MKMLGAYPEIEASIYAAGGFAKRLGGEPLDWWGEGWLLVRELANELPNPRRWQAVVARRVSWRAAEAKRREGTLRYPRAADVDFDRVFGVAGVSFVEELDDADERAHELGELGEIPIELGLVARGLSHRTVAVSTGEPEARTLARIRRQRRRCLGLPARG